ncbi:MAG: GNAT family N-acetyltransferase [Chitinophagaceae bacterium]
MQLLFSSARLVVKSINVHNAAFIKELVNTNDWLQFIGYRNIHSIEDSIAYIEKIINTPQFNYWVVSIKDTTVSVGIISFIKRDYLPHFDIGFAFLPNHQHKGYAFEAVKTALEYIVDTTSLSTILATTLPNNLASIALLQKVGFAFQKSQVINGQELSVYTLKFQNNKNE